MAVKHFSESIEDFRNRCIGGIMTTSAKERAAETKAIEQQLAEVRRGAAVSHAIQAMGLLPVGERTVKTLLGNAKAIDAFLKGGR